MNDEIEKLDAVHTAARGHYLHAADAFYTARKARDTALSAYKSAVDALTTAADNTADKANFVAHTATAYLAADTAANELRCNIRDIKGMS